MIGFLEVYVNKGDAGNRAVVEAAIDKEAPFAIFVDEAAAIAARINGYGRSFVSGTKRLLVAAAIILRVAP